MGGLLTETVQSDAMRRTVDLDSELEAELIEVVSLTKEKPAVVLRQALRAGLSTFANRFQRPRPEGYFASDYGVDKERVTLESALSKVKQKPERLTPDSGRFGNAAQRASSEITGLCCSPHRSGWNTRTDCR